MKKLSDLKIVPADPRVKRVLEHGDMQVEVWVQPGSAGMRERVMLDGSVSSAPNSAMMASSFFESEDAEEPFFTTKDLAEMSSRKNDGLWDKLFDIYAEVNGLIDKKKS